MFCETLKDAAAELHAQRHGQNIQIFVWHINCQQWFQQSTKLMLLCIGVEVDRNRLWQVNILIHLWKPIIHLINGWLHRGPLLAFCLTFAHSNIFLNFPSLLACDYPQPSYVFAYAQKRTYELFFSLTKIKQQKSPSSSSSSVACYKSVTFRYQFQWLLYMLCLKCFSSQALEKFISLVKKISTHFKWILFSFFLSFRHLAFRYAMCGK